MEEKFIIKHTFHDTSTEETTLYSDIETHFNVPWRLKYTVNPPKYIIISLDCLNRSINNNNWSIESTISSESFEPAQNFTYNRTFSNEKTRFKLIMLGYNDLDVENLTVELTVVISKINGITLKKLRNFGESNKKFSDVVLVLEGERFYVSKLFLASHSSYFEALLMGNFKESGEAEVELKDIDSSDFQKFLELINGESVVREYTVNGILSLADFFNAPTAIHRCEEFLMEKSRKSLKEKFQIAIKYRLECLKKKCISELKTKEEIASLIPEDVNQLDKDVYADLLRKACQL